jgi:hypothetical protein
MPDVAIARKIPAQTSVALLTHSQKARWLIRINSISATSAKTSVRCLTEDLAMQADAIPSQGQRNQCGGAPPVTKLN